jgi:hypothetical protein
LIGCIQSRPGGQLLSELKDRKVKPAGGLPEKESPFCTSRCDNHHDLIVAGDCHCGASHWGPIQVGKGFAFGHVFQKLDFQCPLTARYG